MNIKEKLDLINPNGVNQDLFSFLMVKILYHRDEIEEFLLEDPNQFSDLQLVFICRSFYVGRKYLSERYIKFVKSATQVVDTRNPEKKLLKGLL